jgi:amino acid/peptide:H+ symporter
MKNTDNKNEIQMMFGHPKGLWYMFGTEMWERFGYYLMLGIFSLYMLDGWNNGGMGFTSQLKSDIYGTYLGLVYLTPFIGGLLADRLLGYRRSIVMGGLMMAAGYFMLAMHTIPSFYAALFLIILGNGFFKPNISTLVGNLYSEDALKSKKDSGFNIFYMGINIGAFICNFVAAFMRINYGWGYAFAAAGVGMLVGVIVFMIGNRHIKTYDVVKPLQKGDMSTMKILGMTVLPMFIFGIIGYIIPGNLLGTDTNDAFIIGCLPVILFFIYLAFKSEAKESRAIKALLAVFACVILFFAIFHQNGDALTTWAEDYTDRGMSTSITKPADQIGMAQKLENSAVVSNGEEVFASNIDFFNTTQNLMPKKSKEDLQKVKECTMKLETFDKSYKYFENLNKKDVPTLVVVPVAQELSQAIQADTFANDRRVLNALYATPKSQLPNVIQEKTELKKLAALATKSIQDLTKDLAKEKDEKVKKEITAQISTTESSMRVYEFLATNAAFSDVKKDVPNLKLYSTELYQSINPFWVVVLTPVMVGVWGFFRRRKREPSTPTKIAIGLIITALSALVMVGAVYATNDLTIKASSLWLLASYGVITIGELCLSPMGLSLVSKLSPPRITALMMGGYFLAISVGNKMSGMLSSLWEGFGDDSKQNFFLLNFGLVMAAAVLLFLMLRWLNKVMRENNVL